NLSGCRILTFGDLTKQINQGLVGLASLGRKARNDVAKIRLIERCVLVDLSGEEASSQRTKWNKANAHFLTCRQHFLLRLSPPQRIFALKCSHWLDCVCATQSLHPCFGKSEVSDLTFLDQIFHCSCHVFNRHVRID